MTAILIAQPSAAPELDPLRLLPIAANLLPPEIIDARRGKKIKKLIAAVLAFALLATTGWYFYAQHQTAGARGGVSSAQDQLVQLQHEQAKYDNVVKTQAAIRAIQVELSQLMTSDLQWWQLLPTLRAAAPPGVTLTSVSGTITATAAGSGGASQAPGLGSPQAAGTMTIIGAAPDQATIATFVDSLGSVHGVADPFVTGAQSQASGPFQFTVQIQLTSAALGGRYATPSARSSTGGH